MSTFKVGDRVRVISTENTTLRFGYTSGMLTLGQEGVVNCLSSDGAVFIGSFQYCPADLELVPVSAAIDETNPKDRLGAKKPQLHLVPSAAKIYMAQAFEDGAVKYGAYNWREKKVRMTVYISAAMRHLECLLDGEDIAHDSQKPHIGHILACMAILADAKETGNLIDDRPTPGKASELIQRLEKKS